MNLSRRKRIRYAGVLQNYAGASQADLEKLRQMDLTEEYIKVRKKTSTQPRHLRNLIVQAYEGKKRAEDEEMQKQLLEKESIIAGMKKWLKEKWTVLVKA